MGANFTVYHIFNVIYLVCLFIFRILEMVDRSNCHFTSEETELLETDFAQGNTIVSEEVLKNLDAILERVSLDLRLALGL